MSMILAQISRLDTFVFSAFIQGRLLEAANVDINSVACELQARMLRFNNVDFYNVPEGHASNIPDDTQVRDLLFLVPSTSNSTPVAFKRIDNSGGPNQPPLLLETLQSLDDVCRTLGNICRLPREISVTSNLTELCNGSVSGI